VGLFRALSPGAFLSIRPELLRKAVMLALALPIAVWFSHFCSEHTAWTAEMKTLPFALLFTGCSCALWIYGIRPDVLALPLAFAATHYFNAPLGGPYFGRGDFLRIAIVLAVFFAPIHLAKHVEGRSVTRNAAYLPTLDGWRAVAILLVIVDHTLRGIADQSHTPLPLRFLLGQQGVNIFFGISGFLITWKLLEEKQQTNSISLPQFYRRRIYRIFPAAFAFLLVTGVLCALGLLPGKKIDFASSVLYFRNFIPVLWPSICTAHFWSLSLEEQFYLALPAALLWSRTRPFVVFAAGLAGACGLWRWYFFGHVPGADLLLSTCYRTDFRVDGLLCGCLMAVAVQQPDIRIRLKKALTTPMLLSLAVVFAIFVYWSGERTLFTESLIIPLLLAGTVLSPQKLPGRILEWKPIRWVGRISYSLYLWQQLFLLCPVNSWVFRPLSRFPVNIVASFACAMLSHYCLERPMVRNAHRRVRRQEGQSSVAALPLMSATAPQGDGT
jgi:peptidoglycan/LPS O-acetylase OafA/YrhL